MVIRDGTFALQLCPGEDEKPTKIVLIEFFDRIQQVAVEGHQATDSGAKRRVTVLRSVRVQPCGGVIRSE